MFKTQLSGTYCSVGYHLSRRKFIWACQKSRSSLIVSPERCTTEWRSVDIAGLNLSLHSYVALAEDIQHSPFSFPTVMINHSQQWDKEKPPPVFPNNLSSVLGGSHLTLAACCRGGFKMHTEWRSRARARLGPSMQPAERWAMAFYTLLCLLSACPHQIMSHIRDRAALGRGSIALHRSHFHIVPCPFQLFIVQHAKLCTGVPWHGSCLNNAS